MLRPVSFTTTWTLGSTAFEALVTRPVTKIFCAEATLPLRRRAAVSTESLVFIYYADVLSIYDYEDNVFLFYAKCPTE